MDKINEVAELLKRYTETDDAQNKKTDETTEEASTDTTTPEETDETKKTDNTEVTTEETSGEVKSDGPGKSKIAAGEMTDKKKEAQTTGKSFNKVQEEIDNQVKALDALYNNNYLKKYGKDVEAAYKTTSTFMKKAMGISILVIILLLCSSNVIPMKQILPKIPILGKLLSGDQQAMMQARMMMSSCTYPITSAINMKMTQTVQNTVNKVTGTGQPQVAPAPVVPVTTTEEPKTTAPAKTKGTETVPAKTEVVPTQGAGTTTPTDTTAPAQGTGATPETVAPVNTTQTTNNPPKTQQSTTAPQTGTVPPVKEDPNKKAVAQ